MLSQKKIKHVSIFLLALAALFLLLVIALPIIIGNKMESNARKKSIPNSDNIELWAKFPGNLTTTLKHNFSIFDYSTSNSSNDEVTVKGSISLNETIQYDDFQFNDTEDKIEFRAKRWYDKNTLNETKNEGTIKTFSMGLFEALNTISNPPLYLQGLNGIKYLINKALVSPSVFMKLLFSSYSFSSITSDPSKLLETIFKDIPVEKAKKILGMDPEIKSDLTFTSHPGYYNFISLIGKTKEEIESQSWIKVFSLTYEEIQTFLGEYSLLHRYYTRLYNVIATKFGCTNETYCGNEIIYRQLIYADVTKSIGVEDMKHLYAENFPEFYPFEESPELKLYFDKEYKTKIGDPEANYDEYKASVEQLELMIGKNNKESLINPKNSADFLTLNKTGNSYKAYEIYQISQKEMYFISDYFYDFLPRLFLYQKFECGSNEKCEITKEAKGFSSLMVSIVDKTYGKLSQFSGLYDLVLSKLIWARMIEKVRSKLMKNKQNDINDNGDPSEICPIIMQAALDDGKRVLKICADPEISFDSEENLYSWTRPYKCILSGDYSKCDMTLIDYLKAHFFITDKEIKKIYIDDNFGGVIKESAEIIKKAYDCEEECDNKLLAKKQFWKAEVTKNAPEPLEKVDSVSKWNKKFFPVPIELSFYKEKAAYSKDILEMTVDQLISLSTDGSGILMESNNDALSKRVDFEKNFTRTKKGEEIADFTQLLEIGKLLTNWFLFNNKLYNDYENIDEVMMGTSKADSLFLDFLKGGDNVDCFKPKLTKLTGFDIHFNNNENSNYDIYSIKSKYSDSSDNERQITKINYFPIYNIKKEDYDSLSDSMIMVTAPLYNFSSLSDNYLSDGFQYETDTKDSIYYYDELSSRPLKFDYDKTTSYGGIRCQKYVLDTNNLTLNIIENDEDNYALSSQKFNKPFLITLKNSEDLSVKIKSNDEDIENYICIESMSNMVVNSKINLVYAIYTGNLSTLYDKIENKKIYPIFMYSREYEVNKDSYVENFSGILGFYVFKTTFIIIFVILIIICVTIVIILFIQSRKMVTEKKIMEDLAREPLTHSIDGRRSDRPSADERQRLDLE